MSAENPTPAAGQRNVLVRFARVPGQAGRYRVRCHEVTFSPDRTDHAEREVSDAEGGVHLIAEAVGYHLDPRTVVLLEYEGDPHSDIRFGANHCGCGKCDPDAYAVAYHTAIGDHTIVTSPLGVLTKAELPRRVPEVVQGLVDAGRVREAVRGLVGKLRRAKKAGPSPFGPNPGAVHN